jgi:hypothetical protein
VAAGIAQSALDPTVFNDPDGFVVPFDASLEPLGEAFEPSDVAFEPSDVAFEPSDAPSPETPVAAAGTSPDSEPSVPESEAAPDFAPARRSILAQPDPLKWTAGAEIALRTGPDPHNGQDAGGSAWTPWITSKRRPQAAHW